MFRAFSLCLASALLLSAPRAWGQEPGSETGWDVWRRVPVLHEGRVKPLDTFARQAVQLVCHTTKTTPKLVRDGVERKWEPIELILSWQVEPEAWEEVPCLYAEHERLRVEFLELPFKDEAAGNILRYASPADVERSTKFLALVERLRAARREANQKGLEYQPPADVADVAPHVEDLYHAYELFRNLSGQCVEPGAKRTLQGIFDMAQPHWRSDEVQAMLPALQAMSAGGGQGGQPASRDPAEVVRKIELAVGRPLANSSEADAALAEGEELFATLAFALQQRLAQAPPDEGQADNVRQHALALQARLEKIATIFGAMRRSLVMNQEELRVVPSLNTAALEANRRPEDQMHPWLDLQSLVEGSPELLAREGYPESEINLVRGRFEAVAAAYRGKQWEKFSDAMDQFARSLRLLAGKIEPLREQLPFEKKDERLLAATAYPAVGVVDREVHYNDFGAFGWSWLISLASMVCFLFAAMTPRPARSILNWTAVAVLGLSIAVMVYGFYLRVAITRWAPVTNMYETVVYVALFVSVLGAWFLLLPVLWGGVKLAWRMTALPIGPEASPLSADEERVAGQGLANVVGWAAAVPRLLLMGAVFYVLCVGPYGSGAETADVNPARANTAADPSVAKAIRHYTVVSLLPRSDDVAQGFPSADKWIVWALGLCLLAGSLWLIPRVLLAGALSLAVVPWFQVRSRESAAEQVYARWPFGLAATMAATFAAFTAWNTTVLDGDFKALQPVLRSNFWLTTHVLSIVSSYGAGALAWGLGNIALLFYLFGRYRDPLPGKPVAEGFGPAGESDESAHLARRPPEQCALLTNFVYKAMQVAVVLLALGTILGGVWADYSWGRFWGWDPKEVWALICLLVYLMILHGRYAGWFGNFGLAAGSVFGAAAITMSWYGVNFYLGAGLHSYGFGEGGQGYVASVVGVNVVFLFASWVRYYVETSTPAAQPPAPTDQPRLEAVVPDATK